MIKNNSKKILIFVSSLFVILSAFNIFWFNFIQNESEKVLELKKELELEIAGNYTVEGLKKDIVELENKEKQIDNLFIDRENIVVFIEKIERMADQSGVNLQIQNVEVESPKENSSHGLIKMVLNTNGNWSEVTKFLKLVETIPNNVSIDSLNLRTVSGENVSGWNASFAITGISN